MLRPLIDRIVDGAFMHVSPDVNLMPLQLTCVVTQCVIRQLAFAKNIRNAAQRFFAFHPRFRIVLAFTYK
jgi:hypothetical protein